MIGTIEDHLIAKIKDLFGPKLKMVDSIPGGLDEDLVRRLIITAPAVYLAFLGGGVIPGSDEPGGIEGKWACFVITGHASGQAARRRGDSRQIGAYEIVSLLVPRLHNHVVPDVGSLKLRGVENLFNGTIDKVGVSIYAVQFGLPMYFEEGLKLADLDAFETVHVDLDLADPDGAAGQTDIELPQ